MNWYVYGINYYNCDTNPDEEITSVGFGCAGSAAEMMQKIYGAYEGDKDKGDCIDSVLIEECGDEEVFELSELDFLANRMEKIKEKMLEFAD